MSSIFPKSLLQVHPSLLTTGLGIGNTHRRLQLGFFPPNKSNPLVRKYTRKRKKVTRKATANDQRSYRSLVEDFGSNVHEALPEEQLPEEYYQAEYGDYVDTSGEGYDQHSGSELTRTISLPSTVSEVQDLPPPDVDWILQEHDRRYSSSQNWEVEDQLQLQQLQENQYFAPGFVQPYQLPINPKTNEVNYGTFMDHVQARRRQYDSEMRAHEHEHEHEYEYDQENGKPGPFFVPTTSRGAIPNVYQSDMDEQSLKILAEEEITYESEAKILVSYSVPLIFTFLLENIFPLVCSLTVGYLGKNELAAVSLASMTSNITLGFFEGISTSLDTLCPQAFGAGRYYSVGVHFQRCIAFSMVVYIPFALCWFFSEPILSLVVKEENLISLTAQFLRVLIFGAPAYILFENLKRYLQAQGIFDAGIYVLIICAPLNILLSYLLVWNKYIGVGFIGSAIAVDINFWLMFILLFLYTKYIEGSRCWGGFSRKAFTHWKDLAHLAFSGVVMLEAEEISYELLTLFSTYFGTEYLAAQSAVSSVATLIFMIPFAIGISTSTRIANFIGAGRPEHAHLAAKVGISFSFLAGLLNCSMLILGRNFVALIFSRDESVKTLISGILPLVGFVENFDALNAVAGSCLRGQGMQTIGSIVNLLAYYCFGIPLALFLSWVWNWKLYGLWVGIGCAMLAIGATEAYFVLCPNWERIMAYADKLKASDNEGNEEEYFSDSSDDEGDDDDDEEEEDMEGREIVEAVADEGQHLLRS